MFGRCESGLITHPGEPLESTLAASSPTLSGLLDVCPLKSCLASPTVFEAVGGLITASRQVVIGGFSTYFSGTTAGLFPIRSMVAVLPSIACFGATNTG